MYQGALAHLNGQSPARVGLSGLEPLTPALSAQCSNRLSYRPDCCEPACPNDQHRAVRILLPTSAQIPLNIS
jgi:hypothetical protein